MRILRAQAGLDFLMTYGWALLLIVLVVGALFALGVFDMENFIGSKAIGFTQVGVSAWRIEEGGAMSIQLRNAVGSDIEVVKINATFRGNSVVYATPMNISAGRTSSTISVGTLPGAPAKGGGYSLKVEITYRDLVSGFVYVDSGTLTGRVG
ncbi:MAG: hypothetical protein QXW70_00760 [Candidatus Anstonellales archaeon]